MYLRCTIFFSFQCNNGSETSWLMLIRFPIVFFFAVQLFNCIPQPVYFVFVGQLNLQIPWQNLYTQPVEAVLDGVYLLIVPTASKLM